jgi:hypothetical protein
MTLAFREMVKHKAEEVHSQKKEADFLPDMLSNTMPHVWVCRKREEK